MTIARALTLGVRDSLSSPALLALLWFLLLVLVLPAGVLMEESIRASIGASRVDESLRAGLDLGWLGEYQSRAAGLEETMRVSIVGIGAVLDNLEAWFSGDLFTNPTTAAFGVSFALGWLFLLGGLLDRFARAERKLVLGPFLAACARFFWRLLRLALLSGVLYYGIYRLARWLFPWIERATRDVTVERTVLAWYLAGAALIVGLLALVHLLFAYAKIAIVYEGRRSALEALGRGVRFVAARPARTLGLYCALALLGLALLAAYGLAAPGVGQASALAIAFAFVTSQLYLLARLTLRLTFFAAQTRLYEAERFGGMGTR